MLLVDSYEIIFSIYYGYCITFAFIQSTKIDRHLFWRYEMVLVTNEGCYQAHYERPNHVRNVNGA